MISAGASALCERVFGWRWRRGARCLCVIVGLCAIAPVQALIFQSTGDPEHNTTEPVGGLSGSGWQWVGQWRAYTGVPVGARHFLVASHVGGGVGDVFTYRGQSYAVVAVHEDPETDFKLCQVGQDFPDWAPLYRDSAEVGKTVAVFGRGTTRGAPVLMTNALDQVQTKGWLWGAMDGRLRWGTNQVAGVYNGGAGLSNLLVMSFDSAAGGEEVHAGMNDSSGAVFLDDGGWKLAGVIYAVSGPFSYTLPGTTFFAALTDMGGFYVGNTFVTNYLTDVPSSFYATRVADRLTWIDSIVPQQLPPVDPPTGDSDIPALPPWGVLALAGTLLATGVRRLCGKRTPQVQRFAPPDGWRLVGGRSDTTP